MLVKDVIDFLDSYAPLKYSEDFDNTGLIIGDKNAKVTGISKEKDFSKPKS